MAREYGEDATDAVEESAAVERNRAKFAAYLKGKRVRVVEPQSGSVLGVGVATGNTTGSYVEVRFDGERTVYEWERTWVQVFAA